MYVDRFTMMPTQKQPELQPESPVYVHCTRRCTDKGSGEVFLQVRLVNRSDSVVKTVILRVEGISAYGAVLYTVKEVVLADCNARPRGIFGENKIIALEQTPVERVRITVERVVFSDGVVWRRMPEQRLIPEELTLWKTCRCGMRNPPQQRNCELCGQAFIQPVQQLDQLPDPEYPEEEEPIPIQEHDAPVQVIMPEEEEMAGWLVVLLCIFGVIALLATVAFLTYCVVEYRRNII